MNRFEFDVTIEKAWKTDDGKMHVRAIASDDKPDAQRDRMTEAALKGMANQAKAGLPLLETHRSVFAFGKSTGGDVVKTDKGLQFAVEFELDEKFPQATALYEEVHGGKTEKQLSIGGRINSKNAKAVRFEESDGGVIRAVEDVVLDHIATTRKGQAANDRTKFVSAILKSLDSPWEDDVTKEEGVATKTAIPAAPVEEAEKDAVRGLTFLSKLGRQLGVEQAGKDIKKEEVPVKIETAPPSPATEKGAAEVKPPVVEKAPASKAGNGESVPPEFGKCPASHPVLMDGACYTQESADAATEEAKAKKAKAEKALAAPAPVAATPMKSIGQQVREAVSQFVAGGMNQTGLVSHLRTVLATEKGCDEDPIFAHAEEEVSKALVGKKRMAALAQVHQALTTILAELNGGIVPAAPQATPAVEPPGAGPTEKSKPFDPAKLEKELESRFGEALEKTLADFEKTIATGVEKALEPLRKQNEELTTALGESTEAAKDALSKAAELEERLEAIEAAGGVTQAIPGDDETPEHVVAKSGARKGPWAGMFQRSVTKAQSKM